MRTTAHVDERVTATLDGYTAMWETAKAAFLATFETNPVSAIEWKSEAAVKTTVKHIVALEIADRPDGMTLAEAVADKVKRLEKEIRYEGGRSTSPYANANFHYARDAKVEVLERFEGFVATYAEAAAEEAAVA